MAQLRRRLSPEERRRKRKRRLVAVLGFVLTTIMLSWFFESQATTTVLFVRHAETDGGMGTDAPLNNFGRARAELLADFLQDTDVLAGVDAIYASEFMRTQQTAQPLAERLGVEVAIADQYDVVGFMDHVLNEHKGRIALVVTHSDVLGQLVAELHGHQSVPEIGPMDYDDFYIVTIPWFGKVKTLRLHYGIGWQPYEVSIQSGGAAIPAELGAR